YRGRTLSGDAPAVTRATAGAGRTAARSARPGRATGAGTVADHRQVDQLRTGPGGGRDRAPAPATAAVGSAAGADATRATGTASAGGVRDERAVRNRQLAAVAPHPATVRARRPGSAGPAAHEFAVQVGGVPAARPAQAANTDRVAADRTVNNRHISAN